MSKQTQNHEKKIYQIQVQGWFSQRSTETFENLMINHQHYSEEGAPITILTGLVVDQAALRGILNKLWDMNLSLICVRRLEDQ